MSSAVIRGIGGGFGFGFCAGDAGLGLMGRLIGGELGDRCGSWLLDGVCDEAEGALASYRGEVGRVVGDFATFDGAEDLCEFEVEAIGRVVVAEVLAFVATEDTVLRVVVILVLVTVCNR